MGGGKGGGGGEAAAARNEEQQRQARIREGTSRINSIFEGATTGSGALGAGTAYNPTGTYYTEAGTPWAPQSGRSTDAGGGSSLSAEQQFQQMLSGGKLFSGTTKAPGFDDAFFSGRRQAFVDYANPQLEDQFAKAQKELTFALDRSGNLDSSVRGQKLGELQKLYDTQKQQVADQALGYENEARTSVEDARANLISTLNATGDAQGAANSALSRASILSKPPSFNPLSNLFAEFTSGLGTQAAAERAYAYGGASAPRYNTGLFSPRNAVQVS